MIRVPGRAPGRPGGRARPGRRPRRRRARGRWCSPRTAGPAGCRRPTSRRRSRRWTGCGSRSTSTPRSPQPRRDLAADAAQRRARRRAGRRRAGASAAARGRGRRDLLGCARRAARAPVPRLPRPRGARPLGRALPPAAARDRRPAAAGRGPDRLARPHVRPGLRAARPSAATCDGDEVTDDGPAAGRGSRPSSTCWPPSACARASGTGSTPAELAAVRVGAGLRVARRPTTRAAAVPRGRVRDGAGRDGAAVGASWRRTSATTGCRCLREPDLGFAWADLPLGAGAARWTRCCATADLAAGRLRALVQAGGRPARPDRRREPGAPTAPRRRRPRRTARAAVDPLRRGVVAYSSVVGADGHRPTVNRTA